MALGVNLLCMGGDMVLASDHLAMDDDEESKYAKATDKFLRSLKSKRSRNFIKKLEDKAPALAFIATSFFIFGPRFVMTTQLLRERRAAAKQKATTPGASRDFVPTHENNSVRSESVEREGLGHVGTHSDPFTPAVAE